MNHRDFIPEEYLPTFNTNPIELNIHRIAGLSERFVYFNDDMFLIDAVKPSDFFDGELPRDRFLMEAILPEEDKIKSIIFNDVKLINRHFNKHEILKKYRRKIHTWKNGKDGIRNFLLLPWKKFTGFHDDHLPLAFRKETFEQVWEMCIRDSEWIGEMLFCRSCNCVSKESGLCRNTIQGRGSH